MKKARVFFALLFCLVFALTACSSSNDTGSETETEEEVVAEITDEESMTMGDYSTIEVEQSVIDNVNDDLVQETIDDMIADYEETEVIAEGTVQDGDSVYVSYYATLDGEELENISSDGITISIGSGDYVDGFEDAIIGAEVGDTVETEITYEDDYDDETLAGQTVLFTITIIYIGEVLTPDLDDEFVSSYSEEYFGTQIDTVDELYDYVYETLYTTYLHNAMLEYLQTLQTVLSYEEDMYETLYDYAYGELSYYAELYSTDEETFAIAYGFESADEFAVEETVYYYDLIMLMDYLWDDLDLGEYTDEDIDAALEEYMIEGAYDETYEDLDEFKEACGDTWLIIFEKINFRYDTVMEALEDRVVFVETEE